MDEQHTTSTAAAVAPEVMVRNSVDEAHNNLDRLFRVTRELPTETPFPYTFLGVLSNYVPPDVWDEALTKAAVQVAKSEGLRRQAVA